MNKILSLVLVLFAIGCQTAPMTPAPAALNESSTPDPNVILREGDTIKITFPTSAKFDTTQQIRRDGKIVLPVLGELKAVGYTPAELEKEILSQFGKDLVTKEVAVTVMNSTFPIFVSGAVLRPGKVLSDRPITALEAIMEAGGFDYAKANVKSVRVIRHENNQVKTFTLNLKGILDGRPSEPFYLKASDIVYIPEKFNLF